jgi:hypothetical protein
MSDDLVKLLRRPYGNLTGGERQDAADRIEELEAKLKWVIEERDATFAMMLKRAESAEAKLAIVVSAYRIEAMRRDDYTHEAFDLHIASLQGDKT